MGKTHKRKGQGRTATKEQPAHRPDYIEKKWRFGTQISLAKTARDPAHLAPRHDVIRSRLLSAFFHHNELAKVGIGSFVPPLGMIAPLPDTWRRLDWFISL